MVGRTEARLCRTTRRATVSRVGSGAGPPRDALGRRPPRRFAPVGPRPPRPRRPRPGRRPAAARGERRAAGPRRHDQVASPPQHRAQRRPERRRRPAGARPRLAAGDLAAAAAAGAPPRLAGRSTRGPLRRRLRVIRTRDDLAAYEAARRADPSLTAGLLAIEGAHALDGDPANVEVVADAGFRMMSPSHFFDNAFGGSAMASRRAA